MNKLRILLYPLLFPFVVQAQTENYPPPGILVDNGGYNIHLLVDGNHSNAPTIVFFHGAGDIALHWNLVVPEVGKFANAVAIDQNGEGWSEHGHGMALNQQVFDSYQALKNAELNAPYIVVGHSLGGIIANLFAKEYKNEVAGVVMVDATHPDVVLKIFNRDTKEMEWKKMRLTANESIPEIVKTPLRSELEIKSFQPRRDFGDQLDKFSDRDKEMFNWIYNERPWTYVSGQGNAYEAEVMQNMFENYEDYRLGDLPLLVITGGDKSEPEGDEFWSSDALMAHSDSLQKDLLNLSTNSRHLIAHKSGHQIHIDEPELIVEAIKEMLHELGYLK